MKVILDTNILVNVFTSPSRKNASYKIFELCLTKQIKPQIGSALFNEYEDVLSRSEILTLAKYTKEDLTIISDGFLNVCSWTKINYLWRPNLKDEADNHLIDLAVASNAEFIISRNIKDLYSGDLKFNFKPVTPEEFLEINNGNYNL